jgi:hypothetical protein
MTANTRFEGGVGTTLASNNAVVALGGGRGRASVLRALRSAAIPLTVIVRSRRREMTAVTAGSASRARSETYGARWRP